MLPNYVKDTSYFEKNISKYKLNAHQLSQTATKEMNKNCKYTENNKVSRWSKT